MSETHAALSRRRISAVWIVPVVAMLLGLWLVVSAWLGRGPVVTIGFVTADGIEADVTPVKVRNVQIGVVSDIALNESRNGVSVTAELDADAADLLREDTRFWVVRPRVTSSGISGLGTIVSGAYLEVAPGVGAPAPSYHFQGLEHAPPTPAGTPGLRLTLLSETSGSVGVGDPVLYRGYSVGRVEEATLDVQSREVHYSVFIDAPYDALVNASSRFWNASGISAQLTADGATLNLASLETLIAGGVAFDLPTGASAGDPVLAGETFQLYPDKPSIDDNPHRYGQSYVLFFSQSVRGLSAGAPVTFRGITVGSVERIMVGEGTAAALNDDNGTAIPVLIRVEPGRLEMGDTRAGVRALVEALERAVANGLRGSLETGNLLTGSLYVNLDFFDDPPAALAGSFEGHPTIPTVSTGLGRLQQQTSQLMAKLSRLPLDETFASADAALVEIRNAAAAFDELLASGDIQGLADRFDASMDEFDETLAAYAADSGLPDQLARTVEELKLTLEQVQAVAAQLERDPNSVIFPSRHPPDPEPRAGQP